VPEAGTATNGCAEKAGHGSDQVRPQKQTKEESNLCRSKEESTRRKGTPLKYIIERRTEREGRDGWISDYRWEEGARRGRFYKSTADRSPLHQEKGPGGGIYDKNN